MLVFVLSESQDVNDAGCVDRPAEGELESVPFRLEVKSSLPEGEMAGALEKLRERGAAGESEVLSKMHIIHRCVMVVNVLLTFTLG